jgi:pimeloyl-ACP methyl ester carboxylesterase
VRIWIAAAAAAVFALAAGAYSRLQPASTTGILPTNPPTPYIHTYTTYDLGAQGDISRLRVLVVHGLDSSKDTMQLISEALTDSGFDVFNIDLPGHGDSTVRFDAALARETLRAVVEQLKPGIVLGHSMGAGLLLDLAGDQHFSTMVLLSPPPISVSEIQADRVLLITGAYDIGRVRQFAARTNDLGSPHIEWWNLRWAGHSSAIFNPVHVRRIVEWLGGDATKVRTASRLIAIAAMLICAVVFGVTALPGRKIEIRTMPLPLTIVRYIAAAGAAILILRFFVPLAWLRLFATDYMISFLFLAGLILWIQLPRRPELHFANLVQATAAATFIISIGLIAAAPILHMSLSDGRWWRFPFIAAASLPLFLFDETTIRRIHPLRLSNTMAVITRAVLWAGLITGVLLLNRDVAFLVLIAHLMVFFWIALWFGAYVVHRHTQDPFAAALFAALVQGWCFAAWFIVR